MVPTDLAPQGLWAFALLALTMAATPGPNMVCLLGRTMVLGSRAAYITLAGMAAAFVLHALAAAWGLSLVLMAGGHGLTVLRWAAVLCLTWLAWNSLTQGVPMGSPGDARVGIEPLSAGKLFASGFMVNVLNPLVLVFFLTVLPQFAVHPGTDAVHGETMALGFTYAGVSVGVNLAVTMVAARAFAWMRHHPSHIVWIRRGSALALALLAMKLGTQSMG